MVDDSMAVLADGIAGTLTRIRILDGLPVADTIDLDMRAHPVNDRNMADIEAPLREEIHDGHLYGVALDELDVPSVGRIADPRR